MNEEQVAKMIEDHANLEIERYKHLEDKLTSLQKDMTTMLETWNQAKGVLFFLKWIVGVGGSIVALIAYFKGVK
jgi:hypothetical protein